MNYLSRLFSLKYIFTLSTILFFIIFLSFFPHEIPRQYEYIFSEAGPYEVLSFIFSFLSSLLCLKFFFSTKHWPYLLISAVTFCYAMEEISWGFFVFGDLFNYDGFIMRHNAQSEPNLHNFRFGEWIDFRDLLVLGLSLLFSISLFKDNRYFYRKHSFYALIVTNFFCFTGLALFFGGVIVLVQEVPLLANQEMWDTAISYWYSLGDEVLEFYISLIVFFNFYEKFKKVEY